MFKVEKIVIENFFKIDNETLQFKSSNLIVSGIYELRQTFINRNFHNSRKLNQKKIISRFQVKQ